MMIINESLVDGPILVPIFGPEQVEPILGGTITPIIGYRPGVHYNVAESAMTPALRVFEIFPNSPNVIFAGDESTAVKLTAFLKFPDDETAINALSQAGLMTET